MADLGSLYERDLLAELSERGSIDNSIELAERKGWDHTRLASVIRSLYGARMVVPEEKERMGWAITEEAKVMRGQKGRERKRERSRSPIRSQIDSAHCAPSFFFTPLLTQSYIEHGSFEVRVFAAVPESGIPLDDLKAAVGAQVFGVGYKQAMQQKWIAVEKGGGM